MERDKQFGHKQYLHKFYWHLFWGYFQVVDYDTAKKKWVAKSFNHFIGDDEYMTHSRTHFSDAELDKCELPPDEQRLVAVLFGS